MRIMLIRPPFAAEKFYNHGLEEPLGIEYLANYVGIRHEVEILDAAIEGSDNFWQSADYTNLVFHGLCEDEILSRILHFKPEIIGISWLFSTQDPGIAVVLKAIRRYDKNIKIIAGGPQPSTNPSETLSKFKDVDIIVIGEGEITLLELLDNETGDLKNISGLAYRCKENIVINKPRELIRNLDILPFPRRDARIYKDYSRQIFREFLDIRLKYFFPKEQSRRLATNLITKVPLADGLYYFLRNSKRNVSKLPYANIVSSRGCPNRCTFCAVHNIWGHGWRARTTENVLAEIDELVRKFGIKHINFIDDNFNISRDRTIAICKGIAERNYDLTLAATSGIYIPTLDREVLEWLKKAGIRILRMSIESGNQGVLNNIIKKKINLDQVREIVKICKELGIRAEGAFIFGLPGETIQTMRDSIDYAQSVGFDHVAKFIYQPFPNTVLYDLCLEKGYLTSDFDPKKSYVTGNQCCVKTEDFTPEDVFKIARHQ